MSGNPVKLFGSKIEFESFGKNSIAYMRKMTGNDMGRRFPQVERYDDDEEMWALFGADGQPIAVADDASWLIENAAELDLMTVQVQ